jgi:hypothetical protein
VGDLNSADYAPQSGLTRNPFDPSRKLVTWANATNRQAALNGLNSPAGSPAIQFTSDNQVMAVFSAGPNKVYELEAGDDVIGYRLKSVGRRGVQQP